MMIRPGAAVMLYCGAGGCEKRVVKQVVFWQQGGNYIFVDLGMCKDCLIESIRRSTPLTRAEVPLAALAKFQEE